MIITKLISGLGNQLFQYALARDISIRRNTSLKIDISFFESQNLRSYKLDKYDIKANIASDSEIKNFTGLHTNPSLFSRLYRRIEGMVPRKMRRVYNEREWWTYEPDVLKVGTNVYLNGYWQHRKYFSNLHPMVLSELKLKEEYRLLCKGQVSEIRNQKQSVAVHVRRGDYITDKQASQLMGVLPLQYYYDGIALIKHKLANPCFYFFSDDIDWVKKNLPEKKAVYVKGNTEWMDLELMRNCEHAIIANSSFSWWGAFLNENPNKILIAPKQWVAKPEINKRIELVFPEWIAL